MGTGRFGPEFRYYGESDYKSDFTMFFIRVTEPILMEARPHTHDFDIYLYFLSFDPDNMDDLGAEIEFSLGEEQEKHIITRPCSIYIPKGVFHGPHNFTRVDKPLLFVHANMAPKYAKATIA